MYHASFIIDVMFRHQLLAFAFSFYHLLVPLLLAFGHVSFAASQQLLRAVFTAAAFDAICIILSSAFGAAAFDAICIRSCLPSVRQISMLFASASCLPSAQQFLMPYALFSRLPRAAATDPIQLPYCSSFEFCLERPSPRH
jgi:hypothetical protein